MAKQSRLVNRMKSTLVRLGCNPKLKCASEHLEKLRTPEARTLPQVMGSVARSRAVAVSISRPKQRATVDGQGNSGDEVGLVRSQEKCRIGDVPGSAHLAP